jgi:hypothetical protein
MPSTIIRSASKPGLVLLESRVAVAADGLVTISARFLAPAAGLGASSFSLDSSWPSQFSLPPSTPNLQGGPYLLSKSVSKQNGLTVIDAEFISAASPVRRAVSEATEKLTFSGYKESKTSAGVISGSLSFDYYTTAQTFSYTVIAPNTSKIEPKGKIGYKFNTRAEGVSSLVTVQEVEILSHSRETLGKVDRISITSRRIYEQGGSPEIKFSPFTGLTVSGVQINNPWKGSNIGGL